VNLKRVRRLWNELGLRRPVRLRKPRVAVHTLGRLKTTGFWVSEGVKATILSPRAPSECLISRVPGV
jgi:hypothetical protein